MSNARLILALLLPIIGGCASHAPAPVEDRGAAPATAKPAAEAAKGAAPAVDQGVYHTVRKGETLYSIALDNGQDYKDVAAWNNLDNPNRIRVGQQLRVSPPDNGAPVAVAKPVSFGAPVEVKAAPTQGQAQAVAPSAANTESLKREPKGGKLAYSEEALAKAQQTDAVEKPAEVKPEPRPAEPAPAEKPIAAGDDVDWMWPSNGKLVAKYAEERNKGIDFAGRLGDPILAAAAGTVKYVGVLRGYGNFLVIRHNKSYISVYAHASKILVKEEQSITKGQKVAEVGSSDTDSPKLHFEIRYQGKPADPQKFLPAR